MGSLVSCIIPILMLTATETSTMRLTAVIYTRLVEDAAPVNQKHASPPDIITVKTLQHVEVDLWILDECRFDRPKPRATPKETARKPSKNKPHQNETWWFNRGQQHITRIYNALQHRASKVILTASATAVHAYESFKEFTRNFDKHIRQYCQRFSMFLERFQLILRNQFFNPGFLYPSWKNVTAQYLTVLKIDEMREIPDEAKRVLQQQVRRRLWGYEDARKRHQPRYPDLSPAGKQTIRSIDGLGDMIGEEKYNLLMTLPVPRIYNSDMKFNHRPCCTDSNNIALDNFNEYLRLFPKLKQFQQQTSSSKATVEREIPFEVVADMIAEFEFYKETFTIALLSISNLAAAASITKAQTDINILFKAPNQLSTKLFQNKDENFDNNDIIDFIFRYNYLSTRPRHRKMTISVYTVAKYPDNHNHLLPLKLIKKLDAMSPQEFLKYVLEELTLEERESLMVDERQRRKSFQVGWPYDGNLSGIKLAQAGFYSVNDYDRVQCVFCRGSLHRWEREDVPMIEHARSFNFCRFVKGLSCGNIEYRSDKLTKEDMRNITKFKDVSSSRYDSSRSDLTDSSALGISTNRAAMIEYAVYESRLKTFSRWPKTSSMTPKALCEAGFYYTGFDDMVRCFYCAGAIREWAITDDPYVEHARWFPDCAFLIQVKSTEFVDKVHASTPANKKSVRQTKAEKIAIKKADQAQTIHEDMIETCISLGKSSDDIKAAIMTHGGPFDSIRKMLDAIYAIEDGTTAPVASTPKDIIPHLATDALDSGYDSIMPGKSDGSTAQSIGVFSRADREQKFELGCRNCETRTGRYVPATHIGLPCGHINFCERCNEYEEKKAEEPNYKVRCANTSCGAPLTATMRVYLG